MDSVRGPRGAPTIALVILVLFLSAGIASALPVLDGSARYVDRPASPTTLGIGAPAQHYPGLTSGRTGQNGSKLPQTAVYHPAPSWPGWDPSSGRPSPNMPHVSANTVQLSSANCASGNPPWAWLTFDQADGEFWAADPSDCVAVVNESTEYGTVVATYAVGYDPFGVAVNPTTGEVYVSNTGSDDVSVLNGTTGASVANITVGTSPYGIAYDPLSGNIYVANGGSDNLSVISSTTNRVVASIGVGTTPIGVAVDPSSGQVFVANSGSANVTALSESTNAVVTNIAIGTGPYGVAVDNATDQVYVSDSTAENVSVIDGWNDSVAATIGTGPGTHPEGVAYDPVHRLIWLAADFYTVVVNTTTLTVVGDLATDPSGVAVDPQTGIVCVTNTANATMRCITYPQPIFPYAGIEFSETGLPVTVNWSVTLYWPGYYASTKNSSTSYTQGVVGFEIFDAPDASYSFAIPPAGGYYPSPPTGTVDVSGSTTVDVVFFPLVETYPVNFTESGLPSGTIWEVTLAGQTNRSNFATSDFREPNGTYSFAIPAALEYRATPSVGSVYVDGAAVNVAVAFALPPPPIGNLSVTFSEDGLFPYTQWSVDVNGVAHATVFSSQTISLATGTYTYQAAPVSGFVPVAPSSGSFVLSYSNITVHIVYAPVYSLTFGEEGLPSDTNWSVWVDTVLVSGSGSEIRVEVTPGDHTYLVGEVPGYTSTPTSGTLQVSANSSVTISFSKPVVPTAKFEVIFQESGLPNFTGWCVSVDWSELCSYGRELTSQLANGSDYPFAVVQVPGYVALPAFGTFSVLGQSANLTIKFTPGGGVISASAGEPIGMDTYLLVGAGITGGAAAGVSATFLTMRRLPPRKPVK